MKNYSLAPTEENAYEMLRTNPIGRSDDVFRFVELLSHMEDSCYSIALNGEWGSGKTFFVKQVKLILDAENPQSNLPEIMRLKVKGLIPNQFTCPDCYTTVYYDAWANDNHEDPLLSLIYEAIRSGQIDYSPEQKRSIFDTLSNIADVLTGKNISNFLEALRGSNELEDMQKGADLESLVRDFINYLIEERGNRLVFFIDELDRCKPDYAIRFLERIKHYFDDERVTFVFSVSLSQLQWTVKSYYGSEFNSTRYLDKFFDIRLTLPHVNYEDFLKNRLNMWANDLVSTVGMEVIKYYQFSLREMERYIRLLKIVEHVAQKIQPGSPGRNAVLFSATYFVPIMLGLQMYNIKKFNDFLSGNDAGPLKEILMNTSVILDTKFLLSWGENYATGGVIISHAGKETESIEERIDKIYKVLFGRYNFNANGPLEIGQMLFTATTREEVERITSVLSPLTDFNQL